MYYFSVHWKDITNTSKRGKSVSHVVGIELGSKCLKFALIVFVCGFAGPEYADVVFLVDSSDHLGIKSFPFVKTFINKMISSLPNVSMLISWV